MLPAWAVPKNTSGWAIARASMWERKRSANARFMRASGHFHGRPLNTVNASSDRSRATRTTRMPNRCEQFWHDRRHRRKHLDVLMAVEVRRLQTAIANDLNLLFNSARMAAWQRSPNRRNWAKSATSRESGRRRPITRADNGRLAGGLA